MVPAVRTWKTPGKGGARFHSWHVCEGSFFRWIRGQFRRPRIRLQKPHTAIGIIFPQRLVFSGTKIMRPNGSRRVDLGGVVHPFVKSVLRSIPHKHELSPGLLRKLAIDQHPPFRIAVVDEVPSLESARCE